MRLAALLVMAAIGLVGTIVCGAVVILTSRILVRAGRELPLPGNRVFISFASEDRQEAHALRQSLAGEGITVRCYDPEHRWTDPFDHIAPFIETAHVLVIVPPDAGRPTPWMQFEIDLAARSGVQVVTWVRAQPTGQIAKIVDLARSPARRRRRNGSERFDDLNAAFFANVAADDERNPQDHDLYDSRYATWVAMDRDDGRDTLPVILAIAAWLFVVSLVIMAVAGAGALLVVVLR